MPLTLFLTSQTMFLTPISIIVSTLCITYARVYERCELVRELRNFDLPEDEIPTWVCIAHHESDFNTSAMNPGSGDHGLFQISQIYWCSPPGSGYGCNSPCSKFRDDDIADDLQCIRRIHNEHTRISGDGFNAWVVYPLYCKNDNYQYVAGCSDTELPIIPEVPVNATANEIPYEEVDEYGDGYHFPSLPNFSKTEQEHLSRSFDLNHGYEFPNFPFSRTSIHDSVSVKSHDSVSVKDNGYNFPEFPYSKQSIHEFISVHTPPERTIFKTSNKAEQYENGIPVKPVYSKHSIDDFISVHSPPEKVIKTSNNDKQFEIRLPMKQLDSTHAIHDFLPVQSAQEKIMKTNHKVEEDVNELPVKPVYSKYSIDDFISEHRPPENVIKTSNNAEQDEIGLPMKQLDSTHSIHDIIPVHSAQEKMKTNHTVEQDVNELPVQPVYSKHSIDDFISVHSPPEKVIKTSHNAEQYEIGLPMKQLDSTHSIHDFLPVHSAQEKIMNTNHKVEHDVHELPVKPVYSKHTIDDFISVHSPPEKVVKTSNYGEQDESGLPVKPVYSEYSMDDLISGRSPLEKTIITTSFKTEQDENEFPIKPYSKQSISHEAQKNDERESEISFPPLPKSSENTFEQTSTYDFSPAKKASTNPILSTLDTDKLSTFNIATPSTAKPELFASPDYSKEYHNIYHSVPVSTSEEPTQNRKIDKEDIEYMFPPLPKVTFVGSKITPSHQINIPQEVATERSIAGPGSQSTISSTKYKYIDTSSGVTVKPPIRYSQTSSKITTVKLPISTTESLSKVNLSYESKDKSKTIIHNYDTKYPSGTTSFKSSDTSKKLYSTTKNPTISTNKLVSVTLQYPTSISISNNSITRSDFLKSMPFISHRTTTTLNPLTTSRKLGFTTPSSKPADKYDLQGASSTLTPFIVLKPVTTTLHSSLTYNSSTMTSNSSKSSNTAFDVKPQTTTRKPFTTIPSKPQSVSNTASVPFKLQTTTQKPIFTLKHFTTTTSRPQTTLKTTVVSFKSQTTTRQPFTTIPSKPQSVSKTASVPFKLQTTTQKPIFTLKHFTTTTPRPQTSLKTTVVPFKSQTTTRKPLFTNKSFTTASEPKATKISVVSSAAQKSSVMTTNKPVTSTTKLKIFSSKNPFTTVPTLLSVPYKSPTTAVPQQLYRTTSNPLSKQLTFAPDSFFSWIFGSQTLPPIVPPARPPRPTRPQGERPGGPPSPMNQRPRPGGLPRPPRPGGMRPTQDVFSETQDVSNQGHEFGMSVTRRPFGQRPPRPFQRRTETILPSTRFMPSTLSLAPFTTSIFKMSTVTEAVPSQKSVTSSDTSRAVNVYPTNSSGTSKIPNIFRQSKFELNRNEHVVEVKLDDNFTFLRTRFGYRLFRNNKT